MKWKMFLYLMVLVALFFAVSCNPPEYPPPAIIEITPAEASPGETVVIRGSDFNLVTGISFGDTDTTVTATGDQIIAVVPFGAKPGATKVSVYNYYGSSNPLSFTVNPPKPIIQKTYPLTVFLGDTLTIYGKALTGDDLKVHFGSVEVTKIEEKSQGMLKVIVPLGASSGNIWVSHSDGISNFAFVDISPDSDSQKPLVFSMNPARASAGEEIKIEGKNFTKAGLSVIFPNSLNLPVSGFTLVADTELRIKVPQNGVSGLLQISNNFGASKVKIIVIGKPAIDKLLPISNPAGGPLLIYGKNLESVKTILLDNNKITANIKFYNISANEDILAVLVPSFSPKQYTLKVEDEKKNQSNGKAFEILSGNMALPPGLPGVVIPNLPITNQTFPIANTWNTYRGTYTFFDSGEKPDGSIEISYVDNGSTKVIGAYKTDGSYVKIDLDGKVYEGTFDYSFANIKPFNDPNGSILRMILTPQKSGQQFEFVVPYYLESLSPARVRKNEKLSIKCKFYNPGLDYTLVFTQNNTEIDKIPINQISQFDGNVTVGAGLAKGKYECYVLIADPNFGDRSTNSQIVEIVE